MNFSVTDNDFFKETSSFYKEIKKGRITHQSPSNIALIKYWGKHGVQLPNNPSLSFTLTNAFTETKLDYQSKAKKESKTEISLEFWFENKKNKKFEQKIYKFLENLLPTQPFLGFVHLKIYSQNSFPHSAGIASSASSMAALALCLCDLEKNLLNTLQNEEEFYQKASYLARLGSGSAARSVYSNIPITTWGQTENIKDSSDLFASPYKLPIHDIFQKYQDTILIVSAEEKSVSSRAGHALMEDNPFAKTRYELAHSNLKKLIIALEKGDTETFIEVVENEAFVLHALMMCSSPPFILMETGTLTIIKKIQKFRKKTGIPICFTLDAGANVHVLYPKKHKKECLNFIEKKLKPFCFEGKYLKDNVSYQ
ncbi:mevalonate pyrophosphate decarboxylase [Bernardetia litoralis DSM 6794]|uniref:Mevalonate pyrophosphate decarboxylase n=1 Tax=Bernardetia litoralis (strain ATCC 23117 / DSM 6794 / NBRC 15988 / NCIMB 1366 / Fx l1 / Sio-4) TaxID=880071 RepID=I4ANX0_BERLS|nr:diphosphomevalonate decarboxylase [Bernardetia litoralis]AFM05655.1 mevalonate pyrophosphate decarboxylase [Bernardetia litoralis DSM 6794]